MRTSRRRDRVGLIAFGGILRWLVPGTGLVQLYRIVDALLDTQIILSYYWKEIDVIPRRTLPPSALVIALSPLLDPRSVGALLDLRARGFDLAVIDVSPVPFTARPRRGLDAVAYDIWRLRRDALRHRLQRAGVAVVEWDARSAAAGRPRGGAGIQALRPARARLITAVGALAALAGAGAYAVATADASLGGRGSALADARPGRCSPSASCCAGRATIPWASCCHGCGLRRRRAHGTSVVDGWAAVVGVLLLLAAELASWSIDHDARIRAERVARHPPRR